jgi:Zn-dependent metalloprotease
MRSERMNMIRSTRTLAFGLALLSGLAVTTGVSAQQANKQGAINAARTSNPNLNIHVDPRTGMPSSVSGFRPQANSSLMLGASVTEPSDDQVKQAVDAWFATGELSSVFSTGNPQAHYETQNVRKDPDLPGQYVAHVEQRVNGIPVFGSSAKVTVDRSLAPTALTTSLSQVNIANTTPQVTQAQAIDAARARLADFAKNRPAFGVPGPPMPDVTKADAVAQLVVFDPSLVRAKLSGPTRLAWMVSIETYRVFIDAQTKEAFYFFRDQPSGLLRRVYDLQDSMNFPGQLVIDDGTKARQDPVNPDAQQAFTNTGFVRDFYFLVFDRDSYDDNGRSASTTPAPGDSPIESYVRVGNVQNAYWCKEASDYCPKANVMVFGPDFAGAIDVVGHEITHGVISYEADLLYTDEAGAVNESLADIFGTLIEFNVKGAAGNWLIGETLPGFSMTSPLRDLSNPNMKDSAGHSLFDRTQPYSATNRGQPSRYDQYVQVSDPICATTSDVENGCVHINSGIFNMFAYLVSEGGQGVTGIGKQKLARIAYRALTAKLNKSSGLADAADAFVQACADLADANVDAITSSDCKQVSAAQAAVGLAVTN